MCYYCDYGYEYEKIIIVLFAFLIPSVVQYNMYNVYLSHDHTLVSFFVCSYIASFETVTVIPF